MTNFELFRTKSEASKVRHKLTPDLVASRPRKKCSCCSPDKKQARRQQQQQHQQAATSLEEHQQNGTTSKRNSKSPDQFDRHELRQIRKSLRKKSNEQLTQLLVSDQLINEAPQVKRLEDERDELRKQTIELANFNYAREREFVRDRNKLRETRDSLVDLMRRCLNRNIAPVFEHLDQVQSRIVAEARGHEERSEQMAHDFLNGKQDYDEFISNYVSLRKETSKKRILADRLHKETKQLTSNIRSLTLNTKLDLNNNEIVSSNNNKQNHDHPDGSGGSFSEGSSDSDVDKGHKASDNSDKEV